MAAPRRDRQPGGERPPTEAESAAGEPPTAAAGDAGPQDAAATVPEQGVAPSDGPVPPADGRPEDDRAARADVAEPAGDQDPSVEAEYEAATERPHEEAPSADAPEADVERPDPLAVAERERDEYLALAQRTQADFENFRRRAARDAAAAGARAKAGLVRELLPAVDNLERALAAAPDSDDGLAHGVRLVHSELMSVLERSGVEAVEPVGAAFDPNEHEALSVREGDGEPSGVVLEVVEKGYKLAGTVLRPARVIVSA